MDIFFSAVKVHFLAYLLVRASRTSVHDDLLRKRSLADDYVVRMPAENANCRKAVCLAKSWRRILVNLLVWGCADGEEPHDGDQRAQKAQKAQKVSLSHLDEEEDEEG